MGGNELLTFLPALGHVFAVAGVQKTPVDQPTGALLPTCGAQNYPRTTLPDFRQVVHALILRTRPGLSAARTDWIFGFQRREVRRCECDTLMPKPGPLPHTSHTAAMRHLFTFVRFRGHLTQR